METEASIMFYGGRKKRIDRNYHVEKAFFGDKTEKKDRYELYRKFCNDLHSRFVDLRAKNFQQSCTEILNFLIESDSSKDLVDMVAVMFSESAVSARGEFFDRFVQELEEQKIATFDVARLATGSVYANVESVVEDVVKKIDPNSDEMANDFRQLTSRCIRDSETSSDGFLIIIEDILSFDGQVLEDFLLVLSLYKRDLPFFVLVGLPESNSPGSVLSHKVLRKYVLNQYRVSMDGVVNDILRFLSSPKSPLQFSPITFKLMARTAMENGLACEELLVVIKMAFLEHFRSKRKVGRPAEQESTDEYCLGYWIASNIFLTLALSDPEQTVRGLTDHMDVICAAADEDFLESELFETVLSTLSKLEPEKIKEFIGKCLPIFNEGNIDQSGVLSGFRNCLVQLGKDFARLKELQAEEDKRSRESTGGKKLSMLEQKRNPNVSSNLAKLQKDLANKDAEVKNKVNVLDKKRKELEQKLKRFFESTLTSPPDDAIATTYFDDLDFLRQVFSSSSSKMLATALANPEYGLRYDIYDDAGENIDLSKWFDAFEKKSEDENEFLNEDDDVVTARFYKALSAMEYIGFVAKGRKKGFATKLCFASAPAD